MNLLGRFGLESCNHNVSLCPNMFLQTFAEYLLQRTFGGNIEELYQKISLSNRLYLKEQFHSM